MTERPTASLPPSPTRRTTIATRMALAALAVATPIGLAACSDDEASAPEQVPLAIEEAAPGTVPPPTMPTDCVDYPPGDILSAAEANVRFSTESVCPGYVTITVGTPVTFTNTIDESFDVTVTTLELDGTLGEIPFFARTIPPLGTVDYTFEEEGLYAYRLDALEGFKGTIEVLPPEGFGEVET